MATQFVSWLFCNVKGTKVCGSALLVYRSARSALSLPSTRTDGAIFDGSRTPGVPAGAEFGKTVNERLVQRRSSNDRGTVVSQTSRVALFAAAGMFVGGVAMPSAKAADLGGDCCADLEERVAELEATTARKGNRKMSLTITGQVHRMVIWYDDGTSSTTYYGVDSTNSSSRFTFLGSARVNPSVTMGFEIMIEIEAGGTSSKLNQFDEDGKVGGQIGGSAAPGTSFNQSNVDAYFGDARRVAWWIEHKDVGRLTVGRYRERRRGADDRPRRHRRGGQLQLHPVERQLLHPWPTGSVLRHDLGQPRRSRCRPRPYRARALRQPELARLHLLGVDRRSRRLLGQHAALRRRVLRHPHRRGHRLRAVQRPRDAGNARSDGGVLRRPGAGHPGLGWRPLADARSVRSVRPGPLRGQRIQCSWPCRQRLLGLGGRCHQEGRHALADPGWCLQELVRHRQHRALRRVRQGDGFWC